MCEIRCGEWTYSIEIDRECKKSECEENKERCEAVCDPNLTTVHGQHTHEEDDWQNVPSVRWSMTGWTDLIL